MSNKKNTKKKKHKQVFHAPKTYGEKRKIPMSPLMWGLSGLSWGVQLGLTIFAVTVVNQTYGTAEVLNYNGIEINNAVLYLALPIVGWILTICFRLAARFLPLDMWRLPVNVRKGVVLLQGVPLKLSTILVELSTALAFLYIDIAIYLWGAPSNLALLVWIAALAASVWFPLRRAYLTAVGKKP